jgi:hypothetical protein
MNNSKFDLPPFEELAELVVFIAFSNKVADGDWIQYSISERNLAKLI